MSALPSEWPGARQNGGFGLRRMTVNDLAAVSSVESSAYSFPWSRGNFIDSLAAGYLAEVLLAADGTLVGYFVAMAGVDELHLLNVTVRPERQGRGHGRMLLDSVERYCHALRLPMLWLEVRAGNERARALYRQRGMAEVGLRRGYYPAPRGLREDAIVMSARVIPEARDGLD
jgi:[ribosomal protein S18]-alanine N-acetyltransferase